MSEILDIVSVKDEVLYQLNREEIYKQNLRNFRTVNAFIINDQNKLWIPTRQLSKTLNPGCLDASVGGHVKSGENYDQAIKRETREEVNLELDALKWQCLGKLCPHIHDVSSFMKIYLIRYSCSPNYNKEDFIEAHWLSLFEIKDLIYEKIKSKPDLILLVDFLISTKSADLK